MISPLLSILLLNRRFLEFISPEIFSMWEVAFSLIASSIVPSALNLPIGFGKLPALLLPLLNRGASILKASLFLST